MTLSPTLLSRGQRNDRFVAELIGNSLLTATLFSFAVYLQFCQPVAFVFFVAEDGWSEYATFLCWLATFGFLGWNLARAPGFRAPGHYAFALIAFVIAMEEISWGQRIFNIVTPDVIASRNTQEELNLHNLVHSHAYYRYIGMIIIAGAVVVPILAHFSTYLRALFDRLGVPVVSVASWPLIALPVYFLDYHKSFIAFALHNEIAELFLGIAVLSVSFNLVVSINPRSKVTGTHLVVANAALVAGSLLLAAPLVTHFDSAAAKKWAFREVFSYEFPRYGYYQQADLVLDYVEQHPEYLKSDPRYIHGLVLMRLGKQQAAENVLDAALQSLERKRQEAPDSSELYRDMGKILHVLGKTGEAGEHYRIAIELDRTKIQTIEDPGKEANLRWSLGKTLFAMGRKTEAFEQIQTATVRASGASQRLKIRERFQQEQKREEFLLPADLTVIDTRADDSNRG